MQPKAEIDKLKRQIAQLEEIKINYEEQLYAKSTVIEKFKAVLPEGIEVDDPTDKFIRPKD